MSSVTNYVMGLNIKKMKIACSRHKEEVSLTLLDEV